MVMILVMVIINGDDFLVVWQASGTGNIADGGKYEQQKNVTALAMVSQS